MKRTVGKLAALLLVGLTSGASAAELVTDERTGCKARAFDPSPNPTFHWSGGCKNGLADGSGVAEWFWDGELRDRYEGEYRAGKRNGHGVFVWPNGDRYDGEYRDGKATHGLYTWRNGDRYEGDFRDAQRNGHGVETFANGDRWDGEWVDNKLEGHAIVTWAKGGNFEGVFVKNVPNGIGFYRPANGKPANGMWVNGCFQRGDQKISVGVPRDSCGF